MQTLEAPASGQTPQHGSNLFSFQKHRFIKGFALAGVGVSVVKSILFKNSTRQKMGYTITQSLTQHKRLFLFVSLC